MEIESRYEHLPELKKLPLRQHIVVLSGAGMSAESGLSTFRDKDGLWKQYDWKRLASAAGFYEDPESVLEFYNMRRKRLLEVEPNHAHQLIAELEKWHDVTIITQNVDNLHERAGSNNVIHLHGELQRLPHQTIETLPTALRNCRWMYLFSSVTRRQMVRNFVPISFGLESLFLNFRRQ